MPLLTLRNLSVTFETASGPFRAVDGVDLTVAAGDVVGIVGESGSGKSVAMLGLMGLLPKTATVTADEMTFEGRDMLTLSAKDRREIVGRDVAMIFQEPVASLNPCFNVGFQIGESLKAHLGLGSCERKARTIELLDKVGITDPERRMKAFPHQLSGGMSQRVMIAMAISCNPKLLIADEPTTALDVTIQAQILDLLLDLQTEKGMAMILITHDMGVIAETARRVVVQYAGQQVERQEVATLFEAPHHPYTSALLDAIPERATGARLPTIPGVVPGQGDRPAGCLFNPRCARADEVCRTVVPPRQPTRLGEALCHYPLNAPASDGSRRMTAIVTANALSQVYEISRGFFQKPMHLKAVKDASFSVEEGETLAIVGESGCGKSTLARMLTMIEVPTEGELTIDGVRIEGGRIGDVKKLRSTVQIVFQNPYGALNPRQKVGTIIEEPLKINTRLSAAERRARADAALKEVGLRPEHYERYPHMFSGGQRQRIAIARAIILEPKILVLDEPVSALDVSIQAQVLNLLGDLQDRLGLTYVFISHDLSVVRHVADRVMVMYLGRPVEIAGVDALYGNPLHPYTRALLSATPATRPGDRATRIRLTGELPSPFNPPAGCSFNPRCAYANDRCRAEIPVLKEHGATKVACFAVDEGRLPDMAAKAA